MQETDDLREYSRDFKLLSLKSKLREFRDNLIKAGKTAEEADMQVKGWENVFLEEIDKVYSAEAGEPTLTDSDRALGMDNSVNPADSDSAEIIDVVNKWCENNGLDVIPLDGGELYKHLMSERWRLVKDARLVDTETQRIKHELSETGYALSEPILSQVSLIQVKRTLVSHTPEYGDPNSIEAFDILTPTMPIILFVDTTKFEAAITRFDDQSGDGYQLVAGDTGPLIENFVYLKHKQ
jgi:hypothetical protein